MYIWPLDSLLPWTNKNVWETIRKKLVNYILAWFQSDRSLSTPSILPATPSELSLWCVSAIRKIVWMVAWQILHCGTKGRYPTYPKPREGMIRCQERGCFRGTAVQILDWNSQQQAIKKHKDKENWALLIFPQHLLEPQQTHTDFLHKDTRTRWSKHRHSCPHISQTALDTNTDSQRKALADDKSPVTELRCLLRLCRASAAWWICLIRWCSKTLVTPNGAQLIEARRMTFN